MARRGCRAVVPFLALLAALLLIVAGLPGCLPAQADYEVGLGTREVAGTMDTAEGTLADRAALVVVLLHHYTFVTAFNPNDTDRAFDPEHERGLTHPTARVLAVGPTGAFTVPMPSDVVSMELLFLAADHLTDRFRFARSLGMGRVTYRAQLRAMPDWRSHFYTYIEPRLQHLIVEQRFRLTDQDQQLLGDWLEGQKQRLEAIRAGQSANRDAPGARTSPPPAR